MATHALSGIQESLSFSVGCYGCDCHETLTVTHNGIGKYLQPLRTVTKDVMLILETFVIIFFHQKIFLVPVGAL